MKTEQIVAVVDCSGANLRFRPTAAVVVVVVFGLLFGWLAVRHECTMAKRARPPIVTPVPHLIGRPVLRDLSTVAGRPSHGTLKSDFSGTKPG